MWFTLVSLLLQRVRLWTTAILVIGLVSRVHAQLAKPPETVQSPNASNLGLYGEVPVSFFTGVPSIQIPITELRDGPLAVPVTLSYHASGYRPDMHPGWVGVGWNLNGGGAVTRSQHSYPDEMNWPGVNGRTTRRC